ncbi:MAG: GAF domain-containing protein [Dehalococcoidia bacterium]
MAAGAQFAADVLNFEYAQVLEPTGTGSLRASAGYGWTPADSAGPDMPAEFGSIAGYTLTSEPTVVSGNVTDDPRFESPAVIHEAKLLAGVCARISRHETVFGVLAAYTTRPATVTADEVNALEDVARGLAERMEHARADATLRRAARESATLADIGRIISSSPRIEEVYDRFAEKVRERLTFDHVTIVTIDHVAWASRVVYSAGDPLPESEPGRVWALARTNKEHIVQSRSGTLFGDHNLASLATRVPTMSVPIAAGYRSAVAVPLIQRDEVIGILEIRSKSPNAYGQEDLDFAGRVGAEIAGAVANAELHTMVQRDAEERAVIAELGRIIGSSLHINEVYPRYAEQLRRLIPFDRIVIATLNPGSGTIQRAYTFGLEVPEFQPGETAPLGPLTEQVIRTGSGIIRFAGETYPDHGPDPFEDPGTRVGLRSALSVPLIFRGTAVGAMCLRATRERAYLPKDLLLAERVAGHTAAAIGNAELHTTVQRDAEERAVIAELGRIIGSSLHMSEVYPRYAEQLRRLIPFDRIAISTLNPGSGTIQRSYTFGVEVPGTRPGETAPLGPLNELVIRTGSGIIRFAGEIYPDHGPDPFEDPGTRVGLQSALLVPLIFRGTAVGAMSLRATREHAYLPKDLLLAERVAGLTAAAIGNAELHSALQREITERSVLERLGHLTTVATDFEALVETTHSALAELAPVDRTVLELRGEVDGAPSRTFTCGGPRAEAPGQDSARSQPSSTAPDGAPPSLRATTPLQAGGETIGDLTIEFGAAHPRQSRLESLLPRVAAHVAPAALTLRQRASLRSSAAERDLLARLRQIRQYNMGWWTLCETAASAIRTVLPFDRLAIYAVDEGSDTVTTVFAAPAGAAGTGSRRHHKLAGTRLEEPVRTLRGRVLATDPDEDPEELDGGPSETAGGPGHRSRLIAPVAYGTRMFGAIELASTREGAYEARDLLILETAAALLAPHLDERLAERPAGAGRPDPYLAELMVDAARAKRSSGGPGSPGPEAPVTSIAVAIIGDQLHCRRGLAATLRHPEIRIVADADIASAIAAVRAQGPAVVVYDLHGEDGSSVDAGLITGLTAGDGAPRVLVVAAGADADKSEAQLRTALQAGASGFMFEDASAAALVNAVRELVAGGAVIQPEVLGGLLGRAGAPPDIGDKRYRELVDSLTERDREILAGVAAGRTNGEIAGSLHLAVGTVRNRLVEIYRNLGVSGRAGAVYVATRVGLIR